MIFDFIKESGFDKHSIIFEIGVHFGIDTEKIYELSNKSKIYAFEPDPRNIEILLKRGIHKICFLNQLAVSEKTGKSDFYLSDGRVNTGIELLDNHDWSASSSLKSPKKHLEVHPWCSFDKKIKVRTVALDDFCKDWDILFIDFIWMDVQGAEDLVFKGAQRTLSKTRYLYTEFCNDELYEGQLSLNRILKALPGKWCILLFEGENVLLKNDEI